MKLKPVTVAAVGKNLRRCAGGGSSVIINFNTNLRRRCRSGFCHWRGDSGRDSKGLFFWWGRGLWCSCSFDSKLRLVNTYTEIAGDVMSTRVGRELA